MTEPMDTDPVNRGDQNPDPSQGVSPGTVELTTLMDSVAGVYLVTTQTAVYEISLDWASIRRRPRSGESGAAELRRDFQPIDLVEILECTVGRRMQLLIDLGVAGVDISARLSTRVASIVPMSNRTAAG